MARRHSTGWEVLGFASDPTPGDPDAIRTLARTYLEIGDGAGEAFDLLKGEGAIRNGQGKAMEALRELIDKDLPGKLERTRDSFRDAARAYDLYAGTLTEAQERLDRAIDQAQEVATTANSEVPRPAADATPDQVQALTDQQGRVDAAKERLTAAVALGRDARQLRENGSRTASVVLEDAADKAIEERSGIQKFGDFLADNPVIEIIAGIVVGIVAVFLPVVGIALGALLLGVSIIRMATQGKFDAGDIIIGLVTLVPGGVLLGAAGKVGATIAKFAKFAPALAKLGKGAGTIATGVAAAVKGSTFVRKFITPLGKGLTKLKVNPLGAVLTKAGVDVGTEFTLGLTASAITAGVDGKEFKPGPAAIGSLIGAATGGVLTVAGGTKFANSIKDALTIKGQFKNNIGKAFSKGSAGFAPDGFKFSSAFHVDGKGQTQNTGFHGIEGSTGTDPSTGVLKTTVGTPDGTVTQSTATPGDAAPVVTTKTTTPDGFTSTTEGGANTITSPAGEKVTSDGTTTTVETPLAGPGFQEKAAGAFLGEFAPGHIEAKGLDQGKPTLTTDLPQNGGFTTSGSFGDVTKGPGGGPTTINGPAGADGNPVPQFTLDGTTVETPNGLSVTDTPQFSTVSGDGLSVSNQNGSTSVFNTATPGDGAPPVATHDPATGAIGIDVGGGTSLTGNSAAPNTVTLPDGTTTALGTNGAVTVVNAGGNGQSVVLPPTTTGGPITVTDTGVVSTLPGNTGGPTTVVVPNGPTATLDGTGFTVNSGGATPDTVQFNGGNGTLAVNPAGTTGPVTVSPGGDVSVGTVKVDGAGFGSVAGGGTEVKFSPVDLTVTHHDNSTLTVTPTRFDVGGIKQTGDGTILAGTTTIHPDGSASVSSQGTLFDVNPAGQITATPFGGEPGIAGAPQPTPGNPVTLGNTTVDVDTNGVATVTVTGTGGATAAVSNGTTTVNSGPLQVSFGPNGVTTNTGGLNPAQVNVGPHGSAQVTQGGTGLGVGPDGAITVGPAGGTPAVTVAPTADGTVPTQVTTSGGTSTALTNGGATTQSGGADVAAATVGTDGGVTTTAPAGPHTTVVHGPGGTTATDSGNTFGVGPNGTVTDGPFTVAPNTDAANVPVATVTNTGQGGTAATVGPGGISANDVTTSVGTTGDVTFTGAAQNGGTPTTATSAPNGTISAQGPDGTAAQLPPPRGGNPGAAATLTAPGGGVVSSDGQTFTHSSDGFTTTVAGGQNGTTTTVVHDKSGIGHSVDPNGTVTVQNSPSGSTITADHTQGSVTTPPQTLFGAKQTGGENVLTNGQPGANVTTHGIDPVAEPGSTVSHNLNPANAGEFTTTYGPAQGTFAPGGVTGLGPNPAVTVDTAGNPVGNGAGQTSISTVTGDGHGGITVPTPGGGPTLHHDGFFGGTTSVNTGGVTVTKTPGGQENASTAGQLAGVVDGPANPAFAGPAPGPETFTVAPNNGGPGVSVPVGGKGGSVVDGGGAFEVKSTGNGAFDVSVPGGGNGPQDTVSVAPDGTLNGPGVAAAPPPNGVGPAGPPQATFSNNTTVVSTANGPVITPAGGAGSITTINGGTATTVDNATGVTITQNPSGDATFSVNSAAETSTFQIGNNGVEGTVTTGADGNQATFTVGLGDSGAVQVKDAGGTTVNELDPAGSFNQQHAPAHDYFHHTGGPSSVTDLREYGYEALSSVLKGVVGQGVGVLYSTLGPDHADLGTTLENAAAKLGNGVGNSLANKKLDNQYGFKSGGPEEIYTSIPVKTLGNLNNNADTELLNPPKEEPAKA
ncbi:hypothetical protein ABZ896_21935 [Streptomyces sp. NPDC047072]|uniref:hypothetical protein n=1 Tax=Streptomyces sp. NPDC047072 TaxID=3154809 RepID=UPI0033DB882E